ncbi:family 16 glycosyl hydrolase [Zalerion maritima]|uniref:Crh-like protein n=1 Tax=Zalerion maritima TaxID=339359 RepID=A0AAD5RUJ5_9PEZI|nr:family 16 glycosyl hydrolase [Zalerion maritima]
MLPRLINTAALALTASRLVWAQTSSDCNPVDGDSCDPDPAFGDDEVMIDFTQGESDYFTAQDGTSMTYDDTNGAAFTISKEGEAPTIVSNKYLFFGKVSCVIQAAPGTGIVTSFTLQSDDLDEIDWEWVGSDTGNSQSNYFGKGDTTTYDRGAYHTTESATTEFHTYAVEWTSESIQWIIDGTTVRTLGYADATDTVTGDRFPQTPMQVRLGTWVGGSSDNSEGTIEWAGGLANFDDAPFVAYYQSCTIQDYAGGISGAKEYIYGDDSGDYDSIEVATADNSTTTSTETNSSKGTSSTATSDSTSTTATEATSTATSTAGPGSDDDNEDDNSNDNDNDDETTMITATKTASDSTATSSTNSTSSSSSTSTDPVGSSTGAHLSPSSFFLAAGTLLLGVFAL